MVQYSTQISIERREIKNMAEKKTASSSHDNADRRAGTRQGPYVNNGKLPRSRNNNGQWRAKRSDAGHTRPKK